MTRSRSHWSGTAIPLGSKASSTSSGSGVQRKGLLRLYVTKYTRVLSNGKSISRNVSIAPLVLNLVREPAYSLVDQCPREPAARIARLNAWRATPAGGNLAPYVPPAREPGGSSSTNLLRGIWTGPSERFSRLSLDRWLRRKSLSTPVS